MKSSQKLDIGYLSSLWRRWKTNKGPSKQLVVLIKKKVPIRWQLIKISASSRPQRGLGRVSSENKKRVCSRWARFQREHIFMNSLFHEGVSEFTSPRGSERSELASLWMERASEVSKWSEPRKAEHCRASERCERCEQTNTASDRVTR